MPATAVPAILRAMAPAVTAQAVLAVAMVRTTITPAVAGVDTAAMAAAVPVVAVQFTLLPIRPAMKHLRSLRRNPMLQHQPRFLFRCLLMPSCMLMAN